MTAVLLAGSTGYLGRALTARLIPEVPVIGLTRRDLPARPGVTWVNWGDDDAIRAVAGDQEIVIVDCIGESRESKMGITQAGNYHAMERLIGIGRHLNTRRVAYFSGYGTGMPTTSVYFATKTASENLLAESGLPWVSLRASYIVGGPDEIFPMLIAAARSSGVIDYPGSGNYRVQPIHVEDVASVIHAIATRDALATGPHDVLGGVISYRAFLEHTLGRLPLRLVSQDIERALADATVRADAPLSLDQLAILVCDKVGEPTQELGGVKFRPLEAIIAELAAHWEGVWNGK